MCLGQITALVADQEQALQARPPLLAAVKEKNEAVKRLETEIKRSAVPHFPFYKLIL